MKLSLLKANLPFSKVIKVHNREERYTRDDFQYPAHDVPAQCEFYFQRTKQAIQEIWEIFYQFLEKKI